MLVHRHQLDMGEAKVAGVARQGVRKFAIGQPAVTVATSPRSEMDLVDRNRRVACIDRVGRRCGARQRRFIENDRRGFGSHFCRKRHRIGFQRQQATPVIGDREFVAVAHACAGNEQFPISVASHAHRVPAPVPEIEIADDGDSSCIGRKHDESGSLHAVHRHRMSAELVIQPLMSAFAEQIEIEIAENRRKAIGVLEFDRVGAIARTKTVALAPRSAGRPGKVRRHEFASVQSLRRARRRPVPRMPRAGRREPPGRSFSR